MRSSALAVAHLLAAEPGQQIRPGGLQLLRRLQGELEEIEPGFPVQRERLQLAPHAVVILGSFEALKILRVYFTRLFFQAIAAPDFEPHISQQRREGELPLQAAEHNDGEESCQRLSPQGQSECKAVQLRLGTKRVLCDQPVAALFGQLRQFLSQLADKLPDRGPQVLACDPRTVRKQRFDAVDPSARLLLFRHVNEHGHFNDHRPTPARSASSWSSSGPSTSSRFLPVQRRLTFSGLSSIRSAASS